MDATLQNIRAAQKIADQINREIESGTFDYARHFPDSPNALTPSHAITFASLADRWLAGVIADPGTKANYLGSINRIWKPMLGFKRVKDVRHSDVRDDRANGWRRSCVSGPPNGSRQSRNDLQKVRQVDRYGGQRTRARQARSGLGRYPTGPSLAHSPEGALIIQGKMVGVAGFEPAQG